MAINAVLKVLENAKPAIAKHWRRPISVEELDRMIEKHLFGGMVVRVLMNRPPIK